MRSAYTAEDLARALGVTARSVQSRATKEAWPFEARPVRGGKKHHYIYSHLPAEVQSALRAAEAEQLTAAGETLPVVKPEKTLSPAVARLPMKHRQAAASSLALVEKARALGRNKQAKERLAAAAGVSYHTLQRQIRKADAALAKAEVKGLDGLEAQLITLAPGYGKTRGQKRAFDEAAIAWGLPKYLNQSHLTARDVYEDLLTEARVQGWAVGSYDTFLRSVKELDPGAVTLAREGAHKYEARMVVKKLRDYREVPPLMCLVGDHHILDAFVHVPGDRPRRPWLTAWLDLRTRAFVGWTWSFQPNSRTIALALRQAILPKDHPDLPMHGLPVSVYIDNGKDYRACGLSGETIDIGNVDYPEWFDQYRAVGIEPYYLDMRYDPKDRVWKVKRGSKELVVKGVRVGGVFSRLAIRDRYATAYHPWAKNIERAFLEVVRGFSRRLPGWCGTAPHEKPEKLAFELKNPAKHLLTLGQLEKHWQDWLAYTYHARPHTGHGMDGLSPRQVWDSLAQPQTVDPAVLDFALLTHKQTHVKSWGFRLPKIGDFELWAEDQGELAAILNRLQGQRVNVLYDPGHPETARVYYQGQLACVARTLRRGSYISDSGLAEHARLQARQRQQAAATLAQLGAEPTKALPSRTMDRLRLVEAAEAKPGQLAEPAEAETAPAALPQAPPSLTAAPTEDWLSDTRPDFFEDALDRARWIMRRKGQGAEVTPADQGFLEGYLASHPELSEGLTSIYEQHQEAINDQTETGT